MLHHCLMAFIVSDEKLDSKGIIVVMSCFSLAALNILLFIFDFQQFNCDIHRCVFHFFCLGFAGLLEFVNLYLSPS